jgi:hypothetical protein
MATTVKDDRAARSHGVTGSGEILLVTMPPCSREVMDTAVMAVGTLVERFIIVRSEMALEPAVEWVPVVCPACGARQPRADAEDVDRLVGRVVIRLKGVLEANR